MKDSVYHMLLRVSALTLALVLLFDSGLLSPVTSQLSQNTQQYLANAVGVGASVKPTELNTLTAEITMRNKELDEREAALAERELSVGIGGAPVERTDTDISTYLLSVILFILVVLIVLNYALDFVRERRLITEKNGSLA